MTVTGQQGSLRYGYYVAADIGPWSVTRDEHGFVLIAKAKKTDTFRLSQRPLVFVVQRPKVVLRWPVIELQITGAECSARLGPMET